MSAEIYGESVTHLCPEGDHSLTPCCDCSPFELPRTDRMTFYLDLVTCPHLASRTPESTKGEE